MIDTEDVGDTGDVSSGSDVGKSDNVGDVTDVSDDVAKVGDVGDVGVGRVEGGGSDTDKVAQTAAMEATYANEDTSRRWGQYPAQPIVAPEGEPMAMMEQAVGAIPSAANRGTGGEPTPMEGSRSGKKCSTCGTGCVGVSAWGDV